MKSTEHPLQWAIGWLGLLAILAYLSFYVVLRQTASRGTIFITRGSPGLDYRGITFLKPTMAKWVHRAYSPVIVLDRKCTNTVVTVNIP